MNCDFPTIRGTAQMGAGAGRQEETRIDERQNRKKGKSYSSHVGLPSAQRLGYHGVAPARGDSNLVCGGSHD